MSAYPLDGPLPKLDAEASNAVKSRFKLVQEMAERDNMTIRELYKYVAGSRGHHIFVGTPEQLADKMQEWVDTKACDGFNIMPPLLPEGIEVFVDQVVPILQERGVFRKEYEGTTLREHFGLEKPVNRYAK